MSWILRHPRLFFLLLSIFLWLASRLSTDNARIVLAYQLDYSGFVSTSKTYLPEDLEVELSGKGYLLIKEWLNPLRKLKLSREELDEIRPDWESGFVLSDIQPIINDQFPSDLVVEKFLDKDKRVRVPQFSEEYWPLDKRLPMEFNREGYIVKVLGLPDSLKVIGIAAELEEQREIGLKLISDGSPINLGWQKQLFRVESSGSNRIIVEPSELETEIQTELSTTIYKQVEIEYPFEEGTEAYVIPSQIELAFTVSLSDYELFKDQEVSVSMPLMSSSPSQNWNVPIQLKMNDELREHLVYMSHSSATIIPVL
jgi:hypothetical protein